MLSWNELKNLIGCGKTDGKFIMLPQLIGVLPNVASDILGEITYYSFFDAGILLLVDEKYVTQITLFIEPNEGFSAYRGELPVYADKENSIVSELGTPLKSGGGKTDALLGYLSRWVKYKNEEGCLHIEFNQNGALSKLSLMVE